MSSVDERIVEMQFDNKEFEKGVSTTLDSLDKLDESLKLEGAKEGLKNLSDYSRSFDLGHISDAVDSIADKFSLFGNLGLQVIERINNAVIDMAVNLGKSLTFEQISAGWSKYETGLRNTLGVMNQADATLEEAEYTMDKLSWYADVTSFDMNAMSTALSSFVSYGIPLEEAIPTIMGIGNSITFAGKSAKEGAAAYSIYATALAGQNMQLRQYDQLVKTNKVWTNKMNEQALELADTLGYLEKVSDGVYKTTSKSIKEGKEVRIDDMRDSLKYGWLNREVLLQLFADMGGAYTNNLAEATLAYQEQNDVVLTLDESMERFGDKNDEMSRKYLESATLCRTYADAIDAVKDALSTLFGNSFKMIFGNVEEATELWTNLQNVLYDIIVGPLSGLASVLKKWNEIGGRLVLIETIKEIYKAVTTFLKPIGTAIERVFGTKTVREKAYALNEFLSKIRNFFISITPGEETIKKLENAWAGFFSILKAAKTAFGFVLKVISPMWKILTKVASFLLTFVSYLGIAAEAASNLFISLFDINFFTNPLGKLATKFSNINSALETFKSIWDTVKEVFSASDKSLNQILSSVSLLGFGLVDLIIAPLKDLTGFKFEGLTAGLKDFWQFLITKLAKAYEFVSGVFQNTFGEDATFFSVIGTLLGKVIDSFKKNIAALEQLIPKWWAAVKKFFGGNKEASETEEKVGFWASLFGAIMKIFSGIQKVVEKIFGGTTITDIFNGINEVLSTGLLLQVITLFKNINKVSNTLADGMESFFKRTTKVLKAFQSSIKAKSLISIAKAVAILVGSVVVLTFINQDKLMMAMGTLMVLFMGLSKVAQTINQMPTYGANDFAKGTNVLMMAGSIALLSLVAAAITNLVKDINTTDLVKAIGLIGFIGLILTLLIRYMELPSTANFSVGVNKGTGKEMLKIALSIYVLAKAFEKFADLDETAMVRGLDVFGAIAGFIIALTVVQGLWKGDVASGSTAFFKMAASFTAIALALKSLDQLQNMDASVKALMGITLCFGLIIGIVAAAHSFSKVQQSLTSVGTAFLLMSLALIPMGYLFKQLGEFTNEQYDSAQRGIIMILQLVGIIGVALGALLLISSKFKASSTKMNLREGGGGIFGMLFGDKKNASGYSKTGTTILEVAGAVIVMSGAMYILAQSLSVLGSLTGEQLLIGLGGLVVSLLSLIAAAALIQAFHLTEAITALGTAFLKMGAALALGAIGMGLIAVAAVPFGMAFVQVVPLIILAIAEILAGLATLIAGAGGVIAAICDVLIEQAPKLYMTIQTLWQVLIATIASLVPDLLSFIGVILIKLLEFLVLIMPDLVNGVVDLIITFINSLADKIRTDKGDIVDAIFNLVDALFELLWEAITQAMGGFFGLFGETAKRDALRIFDEIGYAMDTADEKDPGGMISAAEKRADMTARGFAHHFQDGVGDVKESASLLPAAAAEAITEGSAEQEAAIAESTEKSFLSPIMDTLGPIFDPSQAPNGETPFNTFGKGSIDQLLSGMTDPQKILDLSSGAKDIGESVVSDIEAGSEEDGGIANVSSNILMGFINGLSGNSLNPLKNAAYNVGKTVLDRIAAGADVHSPSEEAIIIGEYVDEGLYIGLQNGENTIYYQAERMAEILMNVLYDGVASLSNPVKKQAEELGEAATDGVATGMTDTKAKVDEAAAETAETVVQNIRGPLELIQKILDEELLVDPTITPVLDFSNIDNGLEALNKRYEKYGLNVASNYWSGLTFSEKLNHKRLTDTSDENDYGPLGKPGSVKVINYNQYNSSPKALDESEIDRRTKTTMAAMVADPDTRADTPEEAAYIRALNAKMLTDYDPV